MLPAPLPLSAAAAGPTAIAATVVATGQRHVSSGQDLGRLSVKPLLKVAPQFKLLTKKRGHLEGAREILPTWIDGWIDERIAGG